MATSRELVFAIVLVACGSTYCVAQPQLRTLARPLPLHDVAEGNWNSNRGLAQMPKKTNVQPTAGQPLTLNPPTRSRTASAEHAEPLPTQRLAQRSGVARPPSSPVDAQLVQLTFPKQVDLQTIVDLVSTRLGLNILYDGDALNETVSIRAPAEVPAVTLLPLLQSVLQMKNLMLVDTNVPGFKRIVSTVDSEQASQLATLAPIVGNDMTGSSVQQGTALTQIFELSHTDAARVAKNIEPFLTPGVANSLPLPNQGILIVTDYADNLVKIRRLLDIMDRENSEVQIAFLTVKNSNATELAAQLESVFEARSNAQVSTTADQDSTLDEIQITADERTNQLVVVGTSRDIVEIEKLMRSLDAGIAVSTLSYEAKHMSVEKLSELIQQLIGQDVRDGQIRSAIDATNNKLFISTTEVLRLRIEKIIKTVDVAPSKTQSPIRFYKLQNVTALEMLQTLRSLEQGRDASGVGDRDGNYPEIRGVNGAVRSPFSPGSNQPVQPRRSTATTNRPGRPGQSLPPPVQGTIRGQDSGNSQAGGALQLPTERVRITADESSNSLIVIAEPEVQRVYQELIRTLDRRRPQVLVEAQLVLVDASDGFSLGVEVSAGDRVGSDRAFAFSAFGLSEIDPTEGALTIRPGTGFNGTIVDPNVADVVIQALARHRRSRILSSPRILVNDNALGVLTSVDEVPFASVNASNVVATTSFAGFAEAGTTIEVTPHISADNYLQLEYRITMNSFTGLGGEGIPPPRKTDEIASVVTVPDGHTVIVGGLNQRRMSAETDGIPGLERVPVLGALGRSQRDNDSSSSLFVFLRPLILRDERFDVLKTASQQDVRKARIRGDYPCSQPVLMK